MIGANGVAAKTIACPRSAEFKEYLRSVFLRYAGLRPAVIWVDDDFRMPFHRPVDFGCFCGKCLGDFAAESGVRLDRKGMVEAILSDRTVDGVRVRAAWRKFSQSSLTDLVGLIADTVHSVDDGIIVGLMCCNPYGIASVPFDFKAWIERARNRDGIVWFRHGSGAYHDMTPYAEEGIVGKNVAIGRNCAMTEGKGVKATRNYADLHTSFPFNFRIVTCATPYFALLMTSNLSARSVLPKTSGSALSQIMRLVGFISRSSF
jgi:hypothetical protein